MQVDHQIPVYYDVYLIVRGLMHHLEMVLASLSSHIVYNVSKVTEIYFVSLVAWIK